MTDPKILAEIRARALISGISAADTAWLDALGWSDAAVPPVKNETDLADYQRREQKLNAAVAHLSFVERAESPEGKLAAALGAKIADWGDRKDADE
jgi:hypothetical protein